MAIAATPEDDAWGAVDSAIALTYFDLAASAYGIGCCWAGYFIRASWGYPPIREYLGLEAGLTIQAALVFGHPSLTPYRIPARNTLQVRWIESMYRRPARPNAPYVLNRDSGKAP